MTVAEEHSEVLQPSILPYRVLKLRETLNHSISTMTSIAEELFSQLNTTSKLDSISDFYKDLGVKCEEEHKRVLMMAGASRASASEPD